MKRPANALALAVLTLLYEKPMHPYEMSTTLRHRSKEESIRLNYGSLYAVVESLRKKGLVAAGETRREGNRPERTIYALTERRARDARLAGGDAARPVAAVHRLRGRALADGCDRSRRVVEDMLRQRLEALAKESAQHQGLHAMLPDGFPEIFTVEGDYAQHMREAETAFVRTLRREDRLAAASAASRSGAGCTSSAKRPRRRGPPAEARRGVPRHLRLGP